MLEDAPSSTSQGRDKEDELVWAAVIGCSGGIVEDQVVTLLRPLAFEPAVDTGR